MLARRIRTDGFVDPCIPSRAPKPPSGPVWVHEVKHDGYRLIVRRDGEAVRLFTRRGYDWTERYPAIAAAAAKLRAKSFTLDGEAVVAGADGVSVFDALHRRHGATDAVLQAFDLLELNGEELRPLPFEKRKAELARLLARKLPGIVFNEHTSTAAPMAGPGPSWGHHAGAGITADPRRPPSSRRADHAAFRRQSRKSAVEP